ncbi:MAG: hypothetical protein ACQESC_02605 [Nanobdellota archaeon]
MVLVFFGFFAIIQNKIVEVNEEQNREILKEMNVIVLSEVSLARDAHADYSHSFTLPSLSDTRYTIDLLESRELVSSFQSRSYVNFLETNVTGEFNDPQLNRTNTLYKVDGIIHLENGSVYDSNLNGIFLNVDPELCYYCNQLDGNCSQVPAQHIDRCGNHTPFS